MIDLSERTIVYERRSEKKITYLDSLESISVSVTNHVGGSNPPQNLNLCFFMMMVNVCERERERERDRKILYLFEFFDDRFEKNLSHDLIVCCFSKSLTFCVCLSPPYMVSDKN